MDIESYNGVKASSMQAFRDFEEVLTYSLKSEKVRQDRSMYETMQDEFVLDDKMQKELEMGEFIFPDLNERQMNERILIRSESKFSAKMHIPDSALYFHKHDFVEMLYMYKGSCLQFIENLNTAVYLNEGDLFLLNQNVIHGLLQQDQEAVMIKVIVPIGWIQNEFIQHLDHRSELYAFWANAKSQKNETYHYLHYSKCKDKEKECIQNMMTEFYLKAPYYEEVIKNYLQLLMVFLEREDKNYLVSKKKQLSYFELGRMTQYIYEHSRTVTLSEMAKVFAFNASYLSRMLHENCQMSFQELVREVRLEKAAVLLITTKDSVENIALQVGYSQAAPIYKGIKQKFNMSPNEYRKKFKRERVK